MRVLVWLHRDLRCAGNPALAWACRAGREPLPVYVHAPGEEAPWAPGGASRWWLHRSLGALADGLAGYGLELRCTPGPSAAALLRLARATGAHAVAWNRRLAPHLAERDAQAARALREGGLEVRILEDGLLVPPERLCKEDGTPYRVYTPFARRLRRVLESAAPHVAPPPVAAQRRRADGCAVDALRLLDRHPWHTRLAEHWQPGETAGWQRLEQFLETALDSYHTQRDLLGGSTTSRLSPHLAFGEISPAQVLERLRPWLDGAHGSGAARGAERFLDELLWREFAYHVLVHFPAAPGQSLNARYTPGPWRDDPAALAGWQRGATGIELVDAALHELWESGWMHNRARMVAASFLVKQLGIHWRHGAAWFWDTLVDADLANNTLGWQWVAGCGVDAAPYHRIFNPDLQAQKFDADRAYRERWLPRAYRAAPPSPLVDLGTARAAALARYRQHVGKMKA